MWLWKVRWVGFGLLAAGLIIGALVLLRGGYWIPPTPNPKPVVLHPPLWP